jgi:hypothetical protein
VQEREREGIVYTERRSPISCVFSRGSLLRCGPPTTEERDNKLSARAERSSVHLLRDVYSTFSIQKKKKKYFLQIESTLDPEGGEEKIWKPKQKEKTKQSKNAQPSPLTTTTTSST